MPIEMKTVTTGGTLRSRTMTIEQMLTIAEAQIRVINKMMEIED